MPKLTNGAKLRYKKVAKMLSLVPPASNLGHETLAAHDPTLTSELTVVRNLLASSDPSSEVVTLPMAATYDASIDVNGAMQLGYHGVVDFERRFGHLPLNPGGLYVAYMGLRNGIEHLNERDAHLQGELNRLVEKIRQVPPFSRLRKPNEIGSDLIGCHAASLAVMSAVRLEPLKPRQERIATGVRLAADKKAKAITVDEHTNQQRLRAMRHLQLSKSYGVAGQLHTVLVAARRRRK
jgi:hypothetical protein